MPTAANAAPVATIAYGLRPVRCKNQIRGLKKRSISAGHLLRREVPWKDAAIVR
jgi:hypothetical protein